MTTPTHIQVPYLQIQGALQDAYELLEAVAAHFDTTNTVVNLHIMVETATARVQESLDVVVLKLQQLRKRCCQITLAVSRLKSRIDQPVIRGCT